MAVKLRRRKKQKPVQSSVDWRKRAACYGDDPEKWSYRDGDNVEATKICLYKCPVREQCLEEAVGYENPPTYGVIRGGISFTNGTKTPCLGCGFAVATATARQGLCYVCRHASPCVRKCGRMVSRKDDSLLCVECRNN